MLPTPRACGQAQLENRLERKLHGTRPTHLVDGAQSTKRVGKRLFGLAKPVASQFASNKTKVRVIENIESLCSEL